MRTQFVLLGKMFAAFATLLLLAYSLGLYARHLTPGTFATLADNAGSLGLAMGVLGLLIVSFIALISLVLAVFFPAKEKP